MAGSVAEGAKVSFGAVLTQLRESLGLTQSDLATRLGVSAGLVSKWESGQRSPTEEAVGRIAETLDLSDDKRKRLILAHRQMHGGATFLSDEPIEHPEDDLLGRSRLVDRLYASIGGWAQDAPLVIGLTGGWGEGKSSVLNLLGANLEADPRMLVVKFDPWFFSSAENLIQGFLTSIVEALAAQQGITAGGVLRHSLRRLRTTLSSLPSVNVLGFGADLSNLAEEAPTLQALKEEFSQAVRQTKRQVVILVDDFDRLDENDLRVMLKLIRLFSSWAPLIYVAAFDREVVERKLRREHEGDHGFLDKLIQAEVKLPVPDARALGRFVDEGIANVSRVYTVQYEADFVERLGEMWRSAMSRRVTTLRAAKRYLNAVMFAVPFVGGEVNYADLFALEFLRLFYPSIYEAVRSHPELFAGVSRSALGGDQENERRKAGHVQLLDSLPTPDDKEAVKAVLSNVFPLFEQSIVPFAATYGSSFQAQWSREQRAAAPDRFPIYFQYGIPEGEVPDTWVRALIGQVNAAKEADVLELVASAFSAAKEKDTLGRLLDRLIHFSSEVSRERAVPTIWAVIGQEQLYETRAQAFERSEFLAAGTLLFALARAFEESSYVQQVLVNIVRKAPLGFAFHVVHFAVPRLNQVVKDWTHVDPEALRTELRQRVEREYIARERNLLTDEPRWGIPVLSEMGHKELATSYLTRLFKADPSTAPPFLAKYVWRPLDTPEFRLHDLAEWVDVDSLRNALRSLSIPAASTDDERFAVRKFLESEPLEHTD